MKPNIMKSIPFVTTFALLAVACAHDPTMELIQARDRYSLASQGPAKDVAPAELYEAKKALDTAEKIHRKDPGSQTERDFAYVAARKAEQATAFAQTKMVERDAQEAARSKVDLLESDRQRAQQTLAEQQRQLEDQQEGLARSQAEQQQLESRLSAAVSSLQEAGKVTQEQNQMVITLNGSVLFEQGSSTLMPIAREHLREVATALQDADPQGRIVIEGHTDSAGKTALNEQLSQARAESVRRYLVEEGLDQAQVLAVGKGESEPVAPNDTAEGRANNRRVEIIIEKPKLSQLETAN